MLASTPEQGGEFSLADTRKIVADLFEPNVRIFSIDYFLSISIAHLLFLVVAVLPVVLPEPAWLLWTLRVFAFVAYSCLYYRCAMFIHELIHVRGDHFRRFRFFWNWFCGCTFLMPTFVYYPHMDHHRRRFFGTQRDGEYIPLACRHPIHILLYLGQSFVIGPLAVFRFLVLSPLSWISPTLRALIHERASSMIMDPTYMRPSPTAADRRVIRVQEVVCFVWLIVIVVAMSTVLRPWALELIVQTYLTSVLIIMLNAIRTIGAHRYYSAGEEMTFVEQMVDSVNYPHGFLAEIWAPTGTRYHALHHLFPSLPYHSLAEAHGRLMAELPEDSPYRQTEERSLFSAIRTLWNRASESSRSASKSEGVASSHTDVPTAV